MPPARRRRRRWGIGLGILVAGAGALAWGSPPIHAAVDAWALAHGHHRYDYSTSFWRALLRVPGRALAGGVVPHLDVQVRPKQWREIERMREQALRKGLIEESEQQKVPGVLAIDGREMPIELRLKGDYTDHIAGEKWSLRIEITGNGEFAGMRRFSIQDPRTKGFQGELLFDLTLRQLSVLAPRYRFVTASEAGTDVGLMAVEEHVANHLLLSQGRHDAPVVHFDEAMVFWGRDDYREATVLPFGENRLQRVPGKQAQAAAACDLLRSFVDGALPARDVFLIEPMAGFLAAATFWGSWHCARWHNLRFAFDPVQHRLEPVGYDANLQMRRPVPSVVLLEEEFQMRVLDDDVVFAAFVRRLRELCAAVRDGSLTATLRAEEAAALAVLQREFWLLEPFPQEELRARAAVFAAMPPERLRAPHNGFLGSLPVRAWASTACGDTVVQFRNGEASPARILTLCWAARDGSKRTAPFQLRASGELPLEVPALAMQTLRGGACPDPTLPVLEMELECGGKRIVQRVPNNPPPLAWRLPQ